MTIGVLSSSLFGDMFGTAAMRGIFAAASAAAAEIVAGDAFTNLPDIFCTDPYAIRFCSA